MVPWGLPGSGPPAQKSAFIRVATPDEAVMRSIKPERIQKIGTRKNVK